MIKRLILIFAMLVASSIESKMRAAGPTIFTGSVIATGDNTFSGSNTFAAGATINLQDSFIFSLNGTPVLPGYGLYWNGSNFTAFPTAGGGRSILGLSVAADNRLVYFDVAQNAAGYLTLGSGLTLSGSYPDKTISSSGGGGGDVAQNATNTFTTTSASPIKIKPSSAPSANTKLIDLQATGAGSTLFSVDAEGDIVGTTYSGGFADAEVSAFSGITPTGGGTITLPIFTGSGSAMSQTPITAFGESLINAANGAAAVSTLGAAGLSATNTFTAITASPIKIKPSSAPAANTKLFDMQATGAGASNFSIDAEGDMLGHIGTLRQLYVYDGDDANVMRLYFGSTLSTTRTFRIDTGDADRTLTIGGNTSISGTNTGDQTITLTGAVTGSGTGSFVTSITTGAVGATQLASSGVAADLYGSGTQIPTFTVDADGRITSAANTAITGAVLTASNNIFTGINHFHDIVTLRDDKDYEVDDFTALKFGEQSSGQSLVLRWKASGEYFELVNSYPDSEPYPPVKLKINGSLITGISASNITGVLPAAQGGAGTVNGILKANGSGTVSQATAGTDYLSATSANTFTNTTAPIKIKPATAPSADTKLFNIEATGAGSSVFSVDEGGDIIGNNATLADISVSEVSLETLRDSSGDLGVSGQLLTSTGTGTNWITTLPVANGGTGITSLGTGIATWLGTPSSANLAAAITDETGTGLVPLATSPTFTTSLLTGSSSFALFNTTATTVNAFGAATAINLGASAASVITLGGASTAAKLSFLEPSGSGTNKTTWEAQAQSADIAYKFPATIGTTGQFLQITTSGAVGTTSWADAGGAAAAIVFHTSGTSTNYTASADTDAARGTAIQTARTAAVSGETIWVNVGGHTISSTLGKSGVSWYFVNASTVTWDSAATDSVMFGDGGSSTSYIVDGAGQFFMTNGGDDIAISRTTNASTRIDFRGSKAYAVGGGSTSAFRSDAGSLFVNVPQIGDGGNSWGVMWTNGNMYVKSQSIAAGYAVVSLCTATPTGDYYVESDDITGAGGGYGILSQNTEATAAIWVICKTLRGGNQTSGAPCIDQEGGKLYVRAQKIFGLIYALTDTGLLYVTADKVSKVADGKAMLLTQGGGTPTLEARIAINHWDDNGHGGDSIVAEDTCTLELIGGEYVAGASTNGISITFPGAGSKLLMQNFRMVTTANAGTSPLTIDNAGSPIILDHSTLVAEGTVNSIEAASAQNVKAYGTYANRVADANITNVITGGLTIDSDVQ